MAAKCRICVSVVSNEFLTLAINSPSTNAANTDSMPVASLIASCDSAERCGSGKRQPSHIPNSEPESTQPRTIEAIVSDDIAATMPVIWLIKPQRSAPGFASVSLAGVGATAAVAQPQADEMALLRGVGVIDKGGAAVPQRAVVDKLHLPRFEVEIDRQCLVLENVEHRRQCRLPRLVDRLALSSHSRC